MPLGLQGTLALEDLLRRLSPPLSEKSFRPPLDATINFAATPSSGAVGTPVAPGSPNIPVNPSPLDLPQVPIDPELFPPEVPKTVPPGTEFGIPPNQLPPGMQVPGGGEGGGGGGGAPGIEPAGIDPFGGQLGAFLLELLENPREIDLLPEGLRAQLLATLSAMMGGQGIPADVLQGARNMVRRNLETRERALLRRQQDSLAGRGILGRGLGERFLRSIEDEISDDLSDAFTRIELENAAAAERGRARGVQGTLGLGRLGAIEEQLEQSGMLDALRLAISRELGLGELDLGRDRLELERIIQEFLLNQDLLGNFFGTGGGGDDDGIDVEELLRGLGLFDPPGDEILLF